MKRKLFRMITNNFGLKLFSVLAACVIWLIVADNNDPIDTQGYRNISVTKINEDRITSANKTYSVLEDTDKVNVYVKARRSVRSKLTASSFTVTADLENYNEALGSVPLTVTCSNSAVTQEQLRIEPASLKISMEDKVEESFGIAVTTSGKPQKGKELGRTTLISGDTIRIAGPQSLIKIIGKVTVPVDITGCAESMTGSYAIHIEDKNGATLSDSQMNNLELKNTDGVVLKNNMTDVYLEFWNVYGEIKIGATLEGEPANGYRVSSVNITPSTVNLVATDLSINQIGSELDLSDSINIEGATQSQTYQIDLNDTLADYTDVRLEADTTSTVTVDVQIEEAGAATIKYPVSDIEVKNEPVGKKLIFSPTDNISISVQAQDESQSMITADDISASIDLSHYIGIGSYTVPVDVTLPEGYDLVSDVTIVVNVENEDQEAEAEAMEE